MDELEQPMESWSFASLYKYNGKNLELSQQQRRDKFLEEQKQKRHVLMDNNRKLCEELLSELSVEEEKMECEELRKSTSNKVKYKLMQSEWFTDIPDDLEENWLVKLCPQGFRVLLVAKNNNTTVSKDGKIILNVRSNFPGGGIDGPGGMTVLDCIFNKCTKTIFVLDCLFWNSMSMLDSEANFRFFWLQTKFKENPAILKCIKYNFPLLELLPAHKSLIQDKMFTLLSVEEQKYAYDGVVFYHKESHYTFGYTPLVAWLASYMLPEKLNIDVSPDNMFRKPDDYVCMETYLQNLNKRKKSKYRSKHTANSEMEVQY